MGLEKLTLLCFLEHRSQGAGPHSETLVLRCLLKNQARGASLKPPYPPEVLASALQRQNCAS